MNAWNRDSRVGVHVAFQLRSPRCLGLETLCWAQGSRGDRDSLNSSGKDPLSLSRLGHHARLEREEGPGQAWPAPVPEEGAFPAGGCDAHDPCTWHSFAEPPARGCLGRDGRVDSRQRTEKHTGRPRGDAVTVARGIGPVWWQSKRAELEKCLCTLRSTPVPCSLPPDSPKKASFL